MLHTVTPPVPHLIVHGGRGCPISWKSPLILRMKLPQQEEKNIHYVTFNRSPVLCYCKMFSSVSARICIVLCKSLVSVTSSDYFFFFIIFFILKPLISFHMITQSVFYPNNRVSSKLKLHTLTIDTSKKKKH